MSRDGRNAQRTIEETADGIFHFKSGVGHFLSLPSALICFQNSPTMGKPWQTLSQVHIAKTDGRTQPTYPGSGNKRWVEGDKPTIRMVLGGTSFSGKLAYAVGISKLLPVPLSITFCNILVMMEAFLSEITWVVSLPGCFVFISLALS